jgi:RHS repeat-associated protein
MQGAGGVGGLLAMNAAASGGAYLAAYDGNGNVTALVNAGNGNSSAQYEYGPFGEVIRVTGPMAKANPLRFSTKCQDDDTDLLYYGLRYLSTSAARWLSRDPAGQADGADTYLLLENQALSSIDFVGLWNWDVHNYLTTRWAGQVGVNPNQSQNIGVADNGIDTQYSTLNFDDPNWGWHFNRSRGLDSRFTHQCEELLRARAECTLMVDNPYNAAAYLGRALHPLQDWVAHADFNRTSEEPSLKGYQFWEVRFYYHNWDAMWHTGGLYGPNDPDNAEMDANGPNGRPTIATLRAGTRLTNGDQAYWTGFHGGHQRINLTEKLTKRLLKDFKAYVRSHAKRCGECWKAFLQDD